MNVTTLQAAGPTSPSPIGYGATEREAIMDLLEKIEEAA